VVEDDFIFGAISNSTSVGGVLTLDPKQVDMRDGLFELLLVRAPRDLAELGECIKALRTHQYNCRMITFLSASSVAVTADPHMCWTLDGEKEEGHHRVQVENLRHAIRLIQRTES
jgi:diacylglycerol kinase family enzyme